LQKAQKEGLTVELITRKRLTKGFPIKKLRPSNGGRLEKLKVGGGARRKRQAQRRGLGTDCTEKEDARRQVLGRVNWGESKSDHRKSEVKGKKGVTGFDAGKKPREQGVRAGGKSGRIS